MEIVIENIKKACGTPISKTVEIKVPKIFCYIEEKSSGDIQLTYSTGFLERVK